MTWTRSSYCTSSGSCVEWRRATACSLDGNCVEIATGDSIQLRDSKDPDGPVLTFTHDEWRVFLAGAKAGEFDL